MATKFPKEITATSKKNTHKNTIHKRLWLWWLSQYYTCTYIYIWIWFSFCCYYYLLTNFIYFIHAFIIVIIIVAAIKFIHTNKHTHTQRKSIFFFVIVDSIYCLKCCLLNVYLNVYTQKILKFTKNKQTTEVREKEREKRGWKQKLWRSRIYIYIE